MSFYKKNKYRNKKTIIDGHKFDSLKEGRRYAELKIMLRSGMISNLELQPQFLIVQGGMIDPKNGRKLANRVYKADFKYTDTVTGKAIVEDVKCPVTAMEPLYRIKRQLFLLHHGSEYTFLET